MYRLLGTAPYSRQIDWQRVHLFWVDERCVPADHEESNFRVAFDSLLSRVSVPEDNIHRIRGEEDPKQEAKRYENEIRVFFGTTGFPVFDLVVLGMGKDGHTASLFPGSSSLEERERLVVPVFEKERHRITLTLPVLNHAALVLFLVAGRSKGAALSQAVGEKADKERTPAGLIRPPHGGLIWLVDQEAAGQIK